MVYLWPSGAATLQGAGEKEITNPPQPQPGQAPRQVKNIHNPSIEVFLPPPEKATGAALIVAAGGEPQVVDTGFATRCNNDHGISPDGKWIAFLSYEKDVKGHPANKDVTLRLAPVGGGQIQVLAKLFGGQGTINVPSWSPDSRHLAFVSYRLIDP